MSGYIGTVSYAISGLAFLLLTILLLSSWRGRLQGALLTGAACVAGIWSAYVACSLAGADSDSTSVQILEILRDGAWFAFLVSLLGFSDEPGSGSRRVVRRAAAGIGAFCLVFLLATIVLPSRRYAQGSGVVSLAVVGGIILALTGLALIEQVYRNARAERRWGIKYLCLGLGGMFAFDFYLYADALLFTRIDTELWAARGIVNALIVPLIAISAARNPTWSLDVAVSRQILFHSATLLGAGIYLILMAAAGYYIRFFGGTWGGVFEATFLFGALILLLMLMFSGTLRARLRIFLSKHFFTYKFDYREVWQRFTRTLSEGDPGVRLHERSIEAIAELVESPGGALWLHHDSGVFERAAHWNMPTAIGAEPATSGLCRFLGLKQWVIDLDEYGLAPERYGDLALPAWLTAIPRAWLVVPLILREQLLGFIVLARSRGDFALNWEVSDLLKAAGRQAASYLAQWEAARALLVARQFESFNRAAAFVVHDLKNLVSQLSLLLANVERHRHEPAFLDDVIGTVENSVVKMRRLLAQLKGEVAPSAPPGSAALDLGATLRQVVALHAQRKPAPTLDPNLPSLMVYADRERLQRVIGHLIQNACEATPESGRVWVSLASQDGQACVGVSDTGHGMSEEFIRDGLFRPFHTTKTGGMGIGVYESQQYLHEIGGKIEVSSELGRGTRFRVFVPLVGAQELMPASGKITPIRGRK
jgi:putative PEP-CTERM system histidine kinase